MAATDQLFQLQVRADCSALEHEVVRRTMRAGPFDVTVRFGVIHEQTKKGAVVP